ncbi:MAG: transporter [Planctomycetota bacterium]
MNSVSIEPADARSEVEREARTLFRWFNQQDDESAEGLEDEIVTDRPDFTEASSTVGRGRWQIESGYTYIRDTAAGVNTRIHSLPEALLRVGVREWLELRMAQNYVDHEQLSALAPLTGKGPEDLYIGAKLGLTEQSGVLPEMALVPQATLPTVDDDDCGGQVMPGLNWLYGWDVNECISFGGSTQGNRSLDDACHSYLELAQSLTVNYAITEKLGAYTETFWFMPTGSVDPGVKPQYYADGGFTYKVTRNLQFDIRAGVGWNNAADDYFTGAGVSYRMGKNTRDPIANLDPIVRR